MVHRPVIGGSFNASFPNQFPDEKVDRLSLSVTPIEFLANDASSSVVGHATGFFWRKDDGCIYLVTARHVLSGRDPFTDEVKSPTGFIPERIRVYPSLQDETNWGRHLGIILSLTANDQRVWLEDQQFQSLRTDIAAIKVAIDQASLVVCLNDPQMGALKLMTHIGFECSILGYPNSNVGGLKTPIWRRGTIASEPFLPVDNKPMFLIDASTSPGFSGAPVFRRQIGPAPIRLPDGSIESRLDSVVAIDFIGVYAGRLQSSYFGGEVPFAFYANRIPLILK